MTVLALLCAAACSSGPRDPRASQSTTPIELAENTTVFTLTTTLTAQRSPAARQREAAALATGALYIPLVDGSGNPALAAGGTATRGTCGVTFVSPSYAITAAHCVDGTTSDLSSLTVQMFRPTPALDAGFLDAASLSGTFPAYEHAQLGAGDGYFVDRYACALVSRCSDQYGGPLACDAAVAAGADTALLHCDGTPGHKYGFLAVANQDDPAAALFMPWKHEVYDVPVAGADTADDRWQHYVVLSGESTNYHYLGQDTSGVEQNQLLPLVSADFPDGTAHHELAASAPFVTTDLWGCHGTSGSGVLQQTPNGLWALLGPAALGNNELTTYLCNHIPSLDGMCRGPGCVGITYVGLATTQGITSGNADNQTALANDCESFAETETSIYTHLPCLVQGTSENTQNGAWAAHLASPTAVSPLDPLRGPVIALAAGESVGLTEFEVAEGTHYRIGLTAWSSTGCPSAPCPTLALNSAAFAVPPSTLTRAFEAPAPLPQPTPMAATYLAQVGGPLVLTPGAVNGAFEVDGLTVRPEAAVNDFDAMPERLEASLVDLEAAPQAQPMRFVGDGKAGFAARLLADERMVLGRQALAPGHRWTAKFAASPASTPADAATAPPALTCGLLDPAGQVVLQADCSSGFVQLDDTAGADARAAFFVQTAVAGEPASIDDLQLVSDAMPDTDGDGIPDAVDPCPTGPQPAGQTLDVTLPATAAFSVCAPEPSNLALPVPQVQNACDPPVLAGRLVSVNGAPLGLLVVAVPADGHVLLPLGASTISWEVRDPAGHVYAALSSTATVTAITGAAQSACCAVTQTVVSGTAGNDALGPENGLASCFLADTGDDFVASGAGGSWISGESGADFLAGGGGDDVILGGDGDDVISGGSGGRLTVYAGAGSDTVEARFAASARIFGGSGADVLVGSDGPDQIFPGAGAVLVVAGGGDDTVTIYDACELAAGLHLSGGAGQDTLITPLSLDDLDRRGVGVDGFESVVVDTAHGYLSPCFGGP